jgi:hypothetical protein
MPGALVRGEEYSGVGNITPQVQPPWLRTFQAPI